MTPVKDALTVQLEYLIIKRVKNWSNLQITLWVSDVDPVATLPQALYWPVRVARMPCISVLCVPNVSCVCDTCALLNLKLADLYCNFTNQK